MYWNCVFEIGVLECFSNRIQDINLLIREKVEVFIIGLICIYFWYV